MVPFCAARPENVFVYRTRWQAEEHNFNTTEGASLVEASCLEPRTSSGDGLMRIEGFPGLGVVALGGHTPGSTLFAVPVAGHLWLFSGDITNTKAALVVDMGKPFYYSHLAVPENTARTAELRRWLAALDARADTTVIVFHDLPDIEASGLAESRASTTGLAMDDRDGAWAETRRSSVSRATSRSTGPDSARTLPRAPTPTAASRS